MTTTLSTTVKHLHLNLDRAGTWLAPLTLRLFIAWEFFESVIWLNDSGHS